MKRLHPLNVSSKDYVALFHNSLTTSRPQMVFLWVIFHFGDLKEMTKNITHLFVVAAVWLSLLGVSLALPWHAHRNWHVDKIMWMSLTFDLFVV